jgi:hypothetical protein
MAHSYLIGINALFLDHPRTRNGVYTGEVLTRSMRISAHVATRPNRLLGALHPCCPTRHGVWRHAAAGNAGLAH